MNQNSLASISFFNVSLKEAQKHLESRKSNNFFYDLNHIKLSKNLKFVSQNVYRVRDKYSKISYYTYDNCTKSNKCHYCFNSVDTDYVGYPIKYWETSEQKEDKMSTTFNFAIRGCFCSFNCSMAFIKRENAFDDKISLLNFMFKLIYPNKILRPAKNYLLLQENGGPLNRNEWMEESLVYKLTNRVKIFDTSREYLIK